MKPVCYIGLPQWNHSGWQDGPLAGSNNRHPLGRYARYFSSVEGNTTFYGIPEQKTLHSWYQETPEHFRFCLKFPKSITHELKLQHCQPEVQDSLERLSLLQDKLAMIWVQLPDSFAPEDLPVLERFFRALPGDFRYGLELRHTGFFRKDDTERYLNALLMELGVNRIHFDTRALFKHPTPDEDTREALSAKPNVPLHVLATGQMPVVRFITAKDWQGTMHYLTPWVQKICHWMQEGRTPFVFLHTPNNAHAPDVAAYFAEQLNQAVPDAALFNLWPAPQKDQASLF